MPMYCSQEFRLEGNILGPRKLNHYMTNELSIVIQKIHTMAYKRSYLYYEVLRTPHHPEEA